jgi:SRSO17 transposase
MFSKWKLIIYGLGIVTGIGATSLLNKRPAFLYNAATTIGSYGIATKRKLETIAGLTKEGVTDFLAESDYKYQERQDGEPRVVKPEKN